MELSRGTQLGKVDADARQHKRQESVADYEMARVSLRVVFGETSPKN